MQAYFAVAIGGILGCCARYAMKDWVEAAFGRDFPMGTLSINILGSFLMGFLFIATLDRAATAPYLRLGILTGVLGGFTTFSAFALDAMALVENGETGKSLLYVALSNGGAIGGVFFGAYIARVLI